MALSALDSGSNSSDGRLCFALATGYRENAYLNGLYVQRDEPDFCVVDFGVVVWGSYHFEQRHRCSNYCFWNCSICQGIMYYLLVVFSVMAAAGAQMLLKQGAKKQYSSFLRQYLNPWVLGGYGIMGASLLLNIFCLSHGVQVKEVSTIESLSYLFVPLLSWLFFKEKITWRKAGAIVVIMVGVVAFFM